jgi:CRISPR type III-A-associated protein Csm2
MMSQANWPDCIDDGYFVNGCLHPSYVARERMEQLAQNLAQEGLTSNQLRKFFQHCRAIEARLRAGSSTWDCEKAVFMKLDFAAADALGKTKIPETFHDFISRNVQAVKTKEDFLDGFLPHFEALVGFGSAYFRNERT